MANAQNAFSNGFSLTDLMIFRRRWWQHPLFWGVALVLLLNIFKTSSSFERIDLMTTSTSLNRFNPRSILNSCESKNPML